MDVSGLAHLWNAAGPWRQVRWQAAILFAAPNTSRYKFCASAARAHVTWSVCLSLPVVPCSLFSGCRCASSSSFCFCSGLGPSTQSGRAGSIWRSARHQLLSTLVWHQRHRLHRLHWLHWQQHVGHRCRLMLLLSAPSGPASRALVLGAGTGLQKHKKHQKHQKEPESERGCLCTIGPMRSVHLCRCTNCTGCRAAVPVA